MYLYHTAYQANLESILKNVLLINPLAHNWKSLKCDSKIFLAFDAYTTQEYAEHSDNKDTIIALKI